MRRGGLFALTAFAAMTFGAGAVAQSIPARVVARWHVRNGVHPMAQGDGRVGLHVSHDATVDARAIGLLALGPGMSSVRLRPDEIEAFVDAHPGLVVGWQPPLRPLLDVAMPRSRAPEYRSATGLDGRGVVVGIIDTGIDVSHPDLRDAEGKTRVAWLLDLSRQPRGTHSELEEEYGCKDPSLGGCAIFGAADIDEALATSVTNDEPRDVIGHGTHVASIAAGNGLGSQDAALAGVAPGATIVAARVTRSGGEDIGDTDTLLAAKFIFEQADRMGMPSVVNMSLGSDFGPHDGTTWLERGLSGLVGPEHPGRALVVAAGNSGTLYVSGQDLFGIHTEARVAPRSTVRIPMRAIGLSGDTVRGTLYVWVGYRAGDDVSVGLEGSGGEEWLAPVPRGTTGSYEGKPGGRAVEVAVINDVRGQGSPIPEGSHGAAMLIDGTWGSDGDLVVLLEGDGTAELWLQGLGDAGPTGSGLGMLFVRALKQGTVNVPATHAEMIAVGAMVNRGRWRDANGVEVGVQRLGPQSPPIEDSVAYFSGAGPTAAGVPKPEISAPGVFVAGAMSRDARPSVNPTSMFAAPASLCPTGAPQCLVVDSQHGISSGTSMAAPMVAGAAALLLSLDATLSQPEIKALLQAGARWPEGEVRYPYQMGPGALDIEGSRLSYELMGRPREREPDPGRSWVVLASSYARPDPAWPVCGYLETRHTDGTPADGFDPSLLELRSSGAEVTQALTPLAPGMWTFCVAAGERSGGGTLRIEVRYRGIVLGKPQALPIAVDPFVATQGLEPRGGCAVGGRRDGARWEVLLMGLVAWVAARWRRGGSGVGG